MACELAGCGPPARPVGPFCDALRALAQGEIDVGGRANELAGHAASLEALLRVAPAEVHADLATLRDAFAGARDAGGLTTLLTFDALTDPSLADVEGRVARFAAQRCGLQYGPVESTVAPPDDGPKTACPGWTGAGSPLTSNRFPYYLDTSAANYFSVMFWSVPLIPAPSGMIAVPRGGSVELRGTYPDARYFALHPNDVETNNLQALLDVDLDPDPGSANPWRGPVPEGAGRRYTAKLVFGEAPASPAPNTSYVGRRADGGFNPLVVLIYRIYGSALGAMPPNAAGAPLPGILVRDADGEVTERFNACEPYPARFTPPEDRTRFPSLPIADFRAALHPGQLTSTSSFGLRVDLMSNPDVLYLGTGFSRARGEVLAVRARKPRTPDPQAGIPPWSDDVDLRMWTVCTYNFWNGGANACLQDRDVATNTDGEYTLVVSRREHRPRNATAAHGVTWLDAGEFLDAQLTWRLLLARSPFLRELRAAARSEEPPAEMAPYLPRPVSCTRAAFEAAGYEGCRRASERDGDRME